MINTINNSKSKEENTMNTYDCEHHDLWNAVTNAHSIMYKAAKSLYFKKKIHDTLGYDSHHIMETAKSDLECAMAMYEKAFTACFDYEVRNRENFRITRDWKLMNHYVGSAEIELYELKIEG